jgi:hypothetical protein
MLQEPRISNQISASRIELINETIQSHRNALSLNQDNADILFNTAQVLTTAAEAAQDIKGSDAQLEAVALLKEAVELFSSCLARQELEFTESQAQAAEDPASQAEDEGDLKRMSPTSPQPPQEWATVVEPVTASTLVETALAELSTLTTLVSFTSSISGSETNEYRGCADVASNLLQQKLPQYIALLPATSSEESNPQPTARFLSLSEPNPTLHIEKPPEPTNPQEDARFEASLAGALFSATIAEAEYRSHLYTTRTYFDRIASPFDSISQPSKPEQSINLASAFADVLVAFASAVLEVPLPSDSESSPQEAQMLRWEALTKAQDLLTVAVQTRKPGVNSDNLPGETSMALVRGDIELHRRQIVLSPTAPDSVVEQAMSLADTLLDNAGSYYTSTTQTTRGYIHDADESQEARIKAAIVSAIKGGATTVSLQSIVKSESRVVRDIEDMFEDGLLGEADKDKLAELLR